MNIVWYILAGLAGGLLGGLGMGGGTLLIPILTIALGVPQQTAQFINLCAFVPMSIMALIVHVKNGFVAYKRLLYIVIPAVGGAVLGSLVAADFNSELLGKLFGGFLVLLGGGSIFMFATSEKKA